MYSDLTEKLRAIVQALNNVEVKGEQNLLNLGGCVAMLREIINRCDQETSTSAKSEE